MTIRLYSWDDASAPQMGDTNDGSLLSILRACLVDGYGSRTAAGWTMPYSDLANKVAVFKPPTSDVYLRLDDNYSYQWAKVRGYHTMSDVDTGTGEFPRQEDLVSGSYFIAVSKKGGTGTTSNADKWHLLVDDANDWFYFFTHYTTYEGGFFFGKYDCADPTFTDAFLLTGHSTSTGMSVSQFPYSITNHASGLWYVSNIYTRIGIPDRIVLDYDDTNYPNPNPLTGKIELLTPEIRRYSSIYVRMGRMPSLLKGAGTTLTIYTAGDKILIGVNYYLVTKNVTSLNFFKYDTDVG
jgi:hypothetical protein